MEYEGINIMLMEGMLKHPRFEYVFNHGELESFWNLITIQPDFREFFRKNFHPDSCSGRIYVSLLVDMTEGEAPVVLADFLHAGDFPHGFASSYGYPAKPGTDTGKYLEILCDRFDERRQARIRGLWVVFAGLAAFLCAWLIPSEDFGDICTVLYVTGTILMFRGMVEAIRILYP